VILGVQPSGMSCGGPCPPGGLVGSCYRALLSTLLLAAFAAADRARGPPQTYVQRPKEKIMYGTSSDMYKRFYVTGSLRNQGDGYVFQLKNTIDSGDISGVAGLTVDGEERSLEGAKIQLESKVRLLSEISWSSPLYVGYGTMVTVYVPGTLEAGEHTLELLVNAPDLGRIHIPITDVVP
jgi:hypothetical protein